MQLDIVNNNVNNIVNNIVIWNNMVNHIKTILFTVL